MEQSFESSSCLNENSTASYYGSINHDQRRDKKQLSNHSMTTLSEKNEDLEAGGGSPSPLKIRRRAKNESRESLDQGDFIECDG
jgi:hypothetical protein